MTHDPSHFISDPIINILASATCGTFVGHNPKKLFPGIYQIGHFSGDFLLCGGNMRQNERAYFKLDSFFSYGVVDSPEQFKELIGPLMEVHPNPMTAFLTHIAKDPKNKGKSGGWRWHKWGTYCGNGNPECEYLDDEEGFENGVYVYHIYDCSDLVSKFHLPFISQPC